MKKRIVLLLTLVISLFIFSSRVEAAKELTCVYKGGLQDGSKMLVQNSNGELFAFINYDDKIDVDDPEWYDPLSTEGNKISIDFHSSVSSSRFDESGYLLSCPSYAQKLQTVWNKSGYTYKFSFSDKDTGLFVFDYDFADELYELPSLDVYTSFTSDKFDEYNQIIANTEWSGQCEYYSSGDDDKITLYFNKERYLLINESDLIYSSTAKFTLSQLWDVVNDLNVCPVRLYELNALPTANLVDNFYFNYYLDASEGGREYVCSGDACNEKIGFVEPEEPEIVIDDCADLFGEELLKKINDFMDIFKIVVPILLVAFGIVDFTKAVFSSNENEMTKSQKTFFKRILAAILVFIAPIFINLILSLANEAWENISPDTCIKQDK